MTDLQELTNFKLAKVALDVLEELERRGNRGLEKARQDVALFYASILCIQSEIDALSLEDALALEDEEQDIEDFERARQDDKQTMLDRIAERETEGEL